MKTGPLAPIKIGIHFEKKDFHEVSLNKVDLKSRVRFLLSLLCETKHGSVEVGIRFCNEAEILQANTQFRKKAKSTDVLSFPGSLFGEEGIYLGDLLICLPVCAQQAKKARSTLAAELEKMLIHGLVHLKGLDHERGDPAWRVMTALERTLKTELQAQFGKPEWCQHTQAPQLSQHRKKNLCH